MKDNSNLLNKVGKEEGFKLPDNYFDTLTARVMARLPEQETPVRVDMQPTWSQRVRPWLYMAALFAGVAFLLRIALPSSEVKAEALAHEEAERQEMEYITRALDEAMLDDYSLYVYLAEGEN